MSDPIRAVLLVDHGSRLDEANALVEEIARRLGARVPDRRVHVAHLELAPPGVPEALDRLVAEGAREIVVLPWFLGPGRHSRTDIPRLVTEAARRHPGVALRVAAPLGAHAGLVEAALDRLGEALDG